MATAARRRWSGRGLTGNMAGSSAVWTGSSSSRRRGGFKKSGPTQRLQSSPTWHGKNYRVLIMRGGGIRRRSLQSRGEESREGAAVCPLARVAPAAGCVGTKRTVRLGERPDGQDHSRGERSSARGVGGKH